MRENFAGYKRIWTITNRGEQSTSTTRSSGTTLFELKATDAGAMISVSKGRWEGCIRATYVIRPRQRGFNRKCCLHLICKLLSCNVAYQGKTRSTKEKSNMKSERE